MNLSITRDRVLLSCTSQGKGCNYFDFGTTKNALGNIVSVLESEFSEVVGLSAGEYVQFVANNFNRYLLSSGKEKADGAHKKIWNLDCTPDAIWTVNSFFRSDKMALSLRELEIWRVHNHIPNHIRPKDYLNVDFSKGIIVDNVRSVKEICFALLYFYAVNDLKLVKCEHCGRWFATDDLHFRYCTRESPCYDVIVYGRRLLRNKASCERAVKTMSQRMFSTTVKEGKRSRKKAVYDYLYLKYGGYSDEIRTIMQKIDDLHDLIKEKPTVENFKKCEEFLYSDEMPRQARPNRKKRYQNE